tara:strand:+ start:139 stop:1221 length:1083 start_codon:yes stop_codon:yes gene_type:complete
MPTIGSFKPLANDDRTTSRVKLHESIPLTGTIVSGTYGTFPNDTNIKNYTHGMFQSVYDYPYLSSSANHILDLSIGIATNSGLSSSIATQRNAKNDMYNEVCQVLAGYNSSASINQLDVSGNFDGTNSLDKMRDVFILNFSRLLTKDEIQKQASGFKIQLGVSASWYFPFGKIVDIYDKNGSQPYYTNSPAGEFNLLYASGSNFSDLSDQVVGLVFYQAGIAILTSSVLTSGSGFPEAPSASMGATTTFPAMMAASAITESCNAFRHRIHNISFNNTTELNSSIYFCRANNSEFNYSSNPTYLSQSQLRVKSVATDNPVSYITTVGLYSQDNALLAVAKLSEPLKKTPAQEYTLRVRLDY